MAREYSNNIKQITTKQIGEIMETELEQIHEETTFLAEWTRKDDTATNIVKITTIVTTDNFEEIELVSWEDIVGELGLETAKLFQFYSLKEI